MSYRVKDIETGEVFTWSLVKILQFRGKLYRETVCGASKMVLFKIGKT